MLPFVICSFSVLHLVGKRSLKRNAEPLKHKHVITRHGVSRMKLRRRSSTSSKYASHHRIAATKQLVQSWKRHRNQRRRQFAWLRNTRWCSSCAQKLKKYLFSQSAYRTRQICARLPWDFHSARALSLSQWEASIWLTRRV